MPRLVLQPHISLNHNKYVFILCHITVLVNNVIGTDGFVFQSAKLMVRLPSSKVKLNFAKKQKGFHLSMH